MIHVGFGNYVLHKGQRSETLDGIGQYVQALGTHLQATPLNQDISLVPFTYGRDTCENLRLGNHALSSIWSSVSGCNFWGAQALSNAVDIIHATDHHIPRCAPTPTVATVMDVIPLSHPEWVRDNLRSLKSAVWKKTLTWADQIITISEYSKSEIIKWTDVAAEKINVIPLGVDSNWFHPCEAQELQRVEKKYDLPAQFFISIGTLQPRKNIESTLRAHQSLPPRERLATPLIIVGRAGWKCEQLIELITKDPLAGAVRWLQRVPQQDVPALLQSACALVFPSLAEGFGLPILEAFASNLPVITSNTSCLPEVTGEAALLIDPMNTSQIAEALRRLRDDHAFANDLKLRGQHRARTFTWDACARATADVYLKMVP
jgi:glycosyltransferase involved in cell wall biosynthesis